jgi:SmpA / OmlA family
MLLAACASYRGSDLRPGEARLEDVQRAMGPPAMRWYEADGSVQLAYPRGPLGYHTFMVNLGPDGRLQRIANVLEDEGFTQIRAGMTTQQVLRVLGPPDYSRSVYFRARDELVWDWRFCSVFGMPSRFQVLFDATSGTVRSAISQVEFRARGVARCSR